MSKQRNVEELMFRNQNQTTIYKAYRRDLQKRNSMKRMQEMEEMKVMKKTAAKGVERGVEEEAKVK